MKVGFIGLGAMGAPIARHLHGHGLLMAVGSRTQEKVDAFAAELGVRAARSVQNFADCDAVVLCVPIDADVLEIVGELANVLRHGTLVIDHSTVGVETARRAAATLATHDIAFLDAPVSGGVEGANNAQLSIMVGGDATALLRAHPILECYGARISHMGDSGAGQATKAVNQVIVAGINEAVCEGLALSEKLGLDPLKLLPTLMAGAANSWFLEKRGASMLCDEFTPGFKCAHMLKDLRIVQGIAKQTGGRTTVIDQATADYAELVERGYGEADTSSLLALKRC